VRASKVVLGLGIGLAAITAGTFAVYRFVPRSPLVRGLYLGERRAPDDGAAAWLIGRRDAARARRVRFHHDDQLFETKLGEAGVEIDVEATLDRAARVGHKGTLLRRLRESEKARRGELDVPLAWFVDEKRARALLERYAGALYRAPVDARLDLSRHLRIPDVPGRRLDVEASLAELRRATHDDEETVELITHEVSAAVTVADLTRVDIEKVVSSFETTFSLHGSGKNRAINIATAASRFDGLVLAPGAIFSFNDIVGPRIRERGFVLAPEIQGDELHDGYGGGTCQASSTLHGAALFGALEILERQSHSRPSSYTKLGLDATVSYPVTDLKIRNTLSFPVMLHAYLPEPTKVRVEILGGDPVARVEYAYGISDSEDFVRRVTVKPNLPPGKRIKRQKGSRGYDVTSVVRVHYYDGREDVRHYFSGYRPAPEVFWVAPDYDLSELPPLPEHAKGIEGSAYVGASVVDASGGGGE